MAFIPHSNGFCFIPWWLLTGEGQFEWGGTAFPLLTQNMSCIALVNFERKISENNIFTFSGLPVAEYEDVVH